MSASFKVATDGLIHSFVYAAWDNVVGPKILKTWPASSFGEAAQPSFDVVDEVGVEIAEEKVNGDSARSLTPPIILEEDQIAKYISVHTLTGHLTKAKHTDYDSINDVCLIVPALGFASQSATFYCLLFPDSTDSDLGAFCMDEPCMNSLSVIFHYQHVKAFWDLQPLVLHLLKKTAERLRVGLSQDSIYYEDPFVALWLGDIYAVLSETSQLPIMRCSVSSPIPVKKMLNNPQVPWDVVVTSMLTTLGSCCVVGKNEDYVNRVIDLLAFFLPDRQQASCSRYATGRFSGGLYLQGLLEGANGVRRINPSDVLMNEFPLTLLDLTRKGRIKFSGHVHEHYLNREKHSREQEFNIIQRKQPDVYFPTNLLLRPFGEASRYVTWCLDQLATHNAEHWSRIIAAFHQALALQANDVIKAVYSQLSKSSGDRHAIRSVRSQLRKSMKITEADFWLLTATAERIKPGFCRIFANYRIS